MNVCKFSKIAEPMANTLSVIKNHLLLFFILLLGLAACENEESCVTSNSNLVQFNFYKIDDTTALNQDDVLLRGVFTNDGQLVPPNENNVLEGLPLNPTGNVSTFTFILADGSQEAVTFYYDREQQLISPECGPDQRYFNLSLDTINKATFDSVRLVNTEVGVLRGVNLEIFTCQNNLYTDSIFINFLKFRLVDSTRSIIADTLLDRFITDAQGQLLFSPDSVTRVGIPVVPGQPEMTLFINQLDTTTGQVTATQTLVLTYAQEEKRSGDAQQCAVQTRYYDLDTVRTSVDSLRFVQRELTLDNPVNLEILDTIP